MWSGLSLVFVNLQFNDPFCCGRWVDWLFLGDYLKGSFAYTAIRRYRNVAVMAFYVYLKCSASLLKINATNTSCWQCPGLKYGILVTNIPYHIHEMKMWRNVIFKCVEPKSLFNIGSFKFWNEWKICYASDARKKLQLQTCVRSPLGQKRKTYIRLWGGWHS